MTRSRFFEGLMHSSARLTYTEVAAMLVDHNPEVIAQHAVLLPHLQNLYQLYQALFIARGQRGAIDFDTTETKIVFGEGQKIERVVPLVRNDAHKLIEECMIAANVAAARFLARHKMPTLYRIHEPPKIEKVAAVREFLREFGLDLGGGEMPAPAHYGQILEAIRDKSSAHLIQTVLLRSLNQAVYSPDNKGHYGLSLPAYLHFTSPIRRFPDLLVHRGIRHILQGGTAENFAYSFGDIEQIGLHCSGTERRADEATRDVMDWLKCEFMLDKVGEEFGGIIVAVTSFGFFVQLHEIYVDGLVHISSLGGDYYQHDQLGHRLVGERTRKTFRLGDTLSVRVMRVNLDDRKIDFECTSETQHSPLAPRDGEKQKKSKKHHKDADPDKKGKKRNRNRSKSKKKKI